MMRKSHEITGRHVLFIMLAFFGTVVAVNVTMAINAAGSWSGLVVKNSYVASQSFNKRIAKAEEQAARGWQHDLVLEKGQLVFSLMDANGSPISLAEGSVSIGRPASEVQDQELTLIRQGEGRYVAPITLAPGRWQAHVRAMTSDGQDWRLRYRLTVPKG